MRTVYKLLLLSSLGAVLAGCSTTQQVAVNHTPQYCYTEQTIVTENNETVQSKTRVECTDDQVKRVTQRRLGMSPNCGEYTYWMSLGGQLVQRKGISCQRLDGSWEIINTSGF